MASIRSLRSAAGLTALEPRNANLAVLRAIATVAFVGMIAGTTAGCELPTSDDADASAPGSTAATDVNGLFGALPTATPGKLRGVWSMTQTDLEGVSDLRLRFDTGKFVVGVKCTYSAQGVSPVVVGQTSTLATNDSLDASNGQFKPSEAIDFEGKDSTGAYRCQGKFSAVTWKFSVSGALLQLDAVEIAGQLRLTKVGD